MKKVIVGLVLALTMLATPAQAAGRNHFLQTAINLEPSLALFKDRTLVAAGHQACLFKLDPIFNEKQQSAVYYAARSAYCREPMPWIPPSQIGVINGMSRP